MTFRPALVAGRQVAGRRRSRWTEPRYRLLESFREYGREKLDARGEDLVIARRHALACLEFAEWLKSAVELESPEVWRGPTADEEHNLRAALEWSLRDRHDVLLGQRLAGKITRLVVYQSSRRDGTGLPQRSISLTEKRASDVLADTSLCRGVYRWALLRDTAP